MRVSYPYRELPTRSWTGQVTSQEAARSRATSTFSQGRRTPLIALASCVVRVKVSRDAEPAISVCISVTHQITLAARSEL